MRFLVLAAASAAAAFVPQTDAPQTDVSQAIQPAQALDHHEWLLDLVGDWKVAVDTPASAGVPAMTFETEESVTALGKLWIVIEGQADFGGMAFRSMMTLGYSAERGVFLGSYVDSMQDFMWSYQGRLEDDGKALVLETTGPALTDPKKMGRYRERIEVIDENHRTFSSSFLGEDGEWTTFMSSAATRAAK